MATITWDSFYPYVQPYVTGCPEIVIESHLQEAAAEFCAKSEVWRFVIDPDYTSKNTADYEIDVPKETKLENILYFYLDGEQIPNISERYNPEAMTQEGTAEKGTPKYYSILDDTSIKFHPTPLTKHTFNGLAVLKPKLTATGVEDFIFETHRRAIAAGAIARIAEIPRKEWTNPELAMKSKIEFERAICEAQGRDTRRSRLRVAPVNFA